MRLRLAIVLAAVVVAPEADDSGVGLLPGLDRDAAIALAESL